MSKYDWGWWEFLDTPGPVLGGFDVDIVARRRMRGSSAEKPEVREGKYTNRLGICIYESCALYCVRSFPQDRCE